MNILHFYAAFLSIFITFSYSTYAQICKPEDGDEYYLKTETLNLREKPDKNSRLIKVLNKSEFSLVIESSDSIRDGYIFVRAISDTIDYNTLERILIEEYYGWASIDFIDFNGDNFSFLIGDEIDQNNIIEIINSEETLKFYNNCKHNPSHLAYAYFQRGIFLYMENKYIDAIDFFNKAIDISTINSVEEKLTSYFYRGKCKFDLNDNYGAMSDFSKLLGQNSRINSRLVLDWAAKREHYKTKVVGVTYPIIDKEDVYLYLAVCKSRLKKNTSALEDIKIVLSNNSKSANAYFIRAQINFNMERKQAACMDASKAGELGASEAYDFITQYCK